MVTSASFPDPSASPGAGAGATPVAFLSERLAEAARYALMRRLLPAIRHNIAGTLQPVGMMSAMLERRMKNATPDLVQLGKNAQALHTLSREAAATSLNLLAWLAPKNNDGVALSTAVQESLGLMNTELSFRGFAVVNQTEASEAFLPQGILRSAFTASLIALTDAADSAASVVVSAATDADTGHIRLTVSLAPGGSPELADMENPLANYRALQWDDVQAIANAEGVELAYSAHHAQLSYRLDAAAAAA